MLHTISNSTIDIDMINTHDAVLFWQDGVILATKNHPILNAILDKTKHCYILKNDIIARGLTPLIDKRMNLIDMNVVISLTEIYSPQMAW